MDDDDRPPACVEHLWRLRELVFAVDGSFTEYECERCGADLLVAPGGVHPETA